jgi:hypothetical protein
MVNLKLTDDDFKEVNSRTGVKYYNIDEKLVKRILDDQEIVERLKLTISKYDGKKDEGNITNILKEIIGNMK